MYGNAPYAHNQGLGSCQTGRGRTHLVDISNVIPNGVPAMTSPPCVSRVCSTREWSWRLTAVEMEAGMSRFAQQPC